MYKRIFLSLMIVLLISTPIHAETINWEPVNYSNPDSISENGLSIEEFNNLSKADWLDILGDKKKVNFAFSAADSSGEDITNEVNPNLSIDVSGLSSSQTVLFKNLDLENTATTSSASKPDLSQFNAVIYVDSVNGNDLADGTENNPLKTFEKAISKFSTGDVIKLAKGNYVTTLGNANKNLTIVGENQKTNLYVTDSYFNGNVVVNFYNLIVEYDPNLSYGLACNINEVNGYNAVFYTKGERAPFYSISYLKTMNVNLYNSSIFVEKAHLYINIVFYGQELFASIKNVSTNTSQWYSTRDYHSKIKDLSSQTSLLDIQFDSNYNITSSGWKNTGTGQNPDGSKANIGVYGGPYSW